MRAYYKEGGQVDKKSMACNKPRRTPSHPKKSHVVKACEGGKEKIIQPITLNLPRKLGYPSQ
jgi:hypothetical protein